MICIDTNRIIGNGCNYWYSVKCRVAVVYGLCPKESALSCSSFETFSIDNGTSPIIDSGYQTYQVTATVPISDAWVKVDLPIFGSGSDITLGQYEDGLYNLGAMAAGETRTAFIYASSPLTGDTTISQTHTATLHEGPPSAISLASATC